LFDAPIVPDGKNRRHQAAFCMRAAWQMPRLPSGQWGNVRPGMAYLGLNLFTVHLRNAQSRWLSSSTGNMRVWVEGFSDPEDCNVSSFFSIVFIIIYPYLSNKFWIHTSFLIHTHIFRCRHLQDVSKILPLLKAWGISSTEVIIEDDKRIIDCVIHICMYII
jgi:hypothetical protein